MNENQNKKDAIVQETKGRGLFYGVIAIATFIIMAVGATFAYFTATTESMNAAVQTGSTTLQLEYISYGDAWMKRDLIPADTVVVEYSVENQNDETNSSDPDENGAFLADGNNTLCKDDHGNSICSIYVFQIRNTANSPQDLSINIVSETNTFANLYAMAYEISVPTDESTLLKYNTIFDADNPDTLTYKNGLNDPAFKTSADDETGTISVTDGSGTPIYDYSPVYINRAGVVKTLLSYTGVDSDSGSTVTKPAIERKLALIPDPINIGTTEERTAQIANGVTVNGVGEEGSIRTYAVVLYILNDKYNDQTEEDAESEFTGQVVVTSGDGGGVSGSIGVINSEDAEDVQSGLETGVTEEDEPTTGA